MRTCPLVWSAVALGLVAGGGHLQADVSKKAKTDRVAELVAQLGDEKFATREGASKALEAIGPPALKALRKAAGSDDAEVRKRADLLIEAIISRPAPIPKGAIVLFDGKSLSGWTTRDGRLAGWPVGDGHVEVAPGKGDVVTKEKFGQDFRLHVEFWLPFLPDKKGQARANSGVYLHGRYEIQVLDSYQNDSEPTVSLGALYGAVAPDRAAQKRAVKPPERWNAFDITFCAPRVNKQGELTAKGKIVVVLNGVKITEGAFDRTSGLALDEKIVESGPILLQDHGSKVRYRNIWLVPAKK